MFTFFAFLLDTGLFKSAQQSHSTFPLYNTETFTHCLLLLLAEKGPSTSAPQSAAATVCSGSDGDVITRYPTQKVFLSPSRRTALTTIEPVLPNSTQVLRCKSNGNKTHPNEDKSEKPESFSAALLCFLLATTTTTGTSSSGSKKVRLGSD